MSKLEPDDIFETYGAFNDLTVGGKTPIASRRTLTTTEALSLALESHYTPDVLKGKSVYDGVVMASIAAKTPTLQSNQALIEYLSDPPEEILYYVYKVYIPEVEPRCINFSDRGPKGPKTGFTNAQRVMTLPNAILDASVPASENMRAIEAGTYVQVIYANQQKLKNPKIVAIGKKVIQLGGLMRKKGSLIATFSSHQGSAVGSTASSKIGGEPPHFDGTQKNGSIICPDRDPIPIPSRYNLDHNAPYGSKLNPMTPKCRLLPKSNENLVPYLGSTSTYSEAAAQIKVSWKEVSGESLTDAQASVLVGQWGSETGGGKSYFNWNPGGIKAYSRWTGKWVLMRTFEYADDEARACGSDCKTWVFSPFRAFDSQSESITSWIKLLTGSRHGVGKPYILAADYVGYARAIGNTEQGGSGYGTADAERYGALIKKLGEGWMAGTHK